MKFVAYTAMDHNLCVIGLVLGPQIFRVVHPLLTLTGYCGYCGVVVDMSGGNMCGRRDGGVSLQIHRWTCLHSLQELSRGELKL